MNYKNISVINITCARTKNAYIIFFALHAIRCIIVCSFIQIASFKGKIAYTLSVSSYIIQRVGIPRVHVYPLTGISGGVEHVDCRR